MDIEKALNILSESHIIVERKKVSEMTPEEYEKDLAARRKRRELRKQRAANASPATQPEKPKQAEPPREAPKPTGKWYVIGRRSPIPETLEESGLLKKLSTDDDVLTFLRYKGGLKMGPFGTKEEAVAAARSSIKALVNYHRDRISKKVKEDPDYLTEYSQDNSYVNDKLYVVDFSDKNRKWSNGRRGPDDSGWWYNSDEEASNNLNRPAKKFNDDLTKLIEDALEEKRDREYRRRNYRSAWDPNSPTFRNVFCHH